MELSDEGSRNGSMLRKLIWENGHSESNPQSMFTAVEDNGDRSQFKIRMSQQLEDTKALYANASIEDQIDLLLPELCFLFRIAGIPVKKTDPLALNIVVFVFMWIIDILMFIVYFNHIQEEDGRFSHFVEIYWAFHSCVIFTQLSYAMYNNAQVFRMILLSVTSEMDDWRCSMISHQPGNDPTVSIENERTVTSTQKSLRLQSRICVYFVIVSVFLNVSILIYIRFDEFLSRHLPWSDSVFFNLVGVVAWYFYSFHWFVAVICVYLPVHFFSAKVKLYIHYLENCLTGSDRHEVIKAMEWYDDLYKVNKLMNFGTLSLLTTTTLMMLMLLLIGLLLSLVKDRELKGPTLFWICTNFIVIACIAHPVADLETANKK